MPTSQERAQIERAKALLEGLRSNLESAVRRGDTTSERSMREEIRRKEQEIRNLSG